MSQNTSDPDGCFRLVKHHNKFYEWTNECIFYEWNVFSYVKIHLYVQRNILLSETKANDVEKSNLITNVEKLVDRLNIV